LLPEPSELLGKIEIVMGMMSSCLIWSAAAWRRFSGYVRVILEN
jgi:hypothetical protein